MRYETYKLGKVKKNPIRRFYTREELESYELPKLREICRTERIKPPTVETFRHRDEMVELVYRYLGVAKSEGITACTAEGCRRLEEALEKNGAVQYGAVDVPARMELYRGQDSLDEREPPYTVACRMDRPDAYAFLADGEGGIQAILTIEPAQSQSQGGENGRKDYDDGMKRYQLRLDAERMSQDIPAGRFHDWVLLFMEPVYMEEAVRRYLGKDRKKNTISYICVPLPEVWVREIPEAEEALVIDYGTSYTTAGTCLRWEGANREKRVAFPVVSGCEWDGQESCAGCGLCPSVLVVKDCSDGVPEHMEFLFGEEAVQAEKAQGFLARNSVFYDMKRWAVRSHERILVTDMAGNTCEVERLFLIRQFLMHVIRQAQQQNRVQYKRLCFTCPVKQKALFLRMYQEALPEYQVLTKDVTDEAVAVVYHFLEQGIRRLDYDDGVQKRVLILDCGGGTSDMVSCDYRITNEAITSSLDLHVTYAHGDTNFGGNHLTWRLMQFLKIRLSEAFSHVPAASIDDLFPGILQELYDRVDMEGTQKAYETFAEVYREAEMTLPTCFELYRNQPESVFLNVRGNFYFLWYLAEAVKKKLYCRPGICRVSLRSLFADFSDDNTRAHFKDFHLFVRMDAGNWETHSICPDLVIEKEEVSLLWKPDIYGFLKSFIEPWYESGRLMEVDRIVLSGQSSKIDLFREVLKEYVAGRKAKSAGDTGCIRKFMCIDGAVAYQNDRKAGRIRTSLSYEPARVPYSLTAEDYETGGREKLLLERGTPMGQVYGRLSRPVGTEEVLFHLKDGAGREVFCISYSLQREDYQEYGYETLLSEYPFLLQEDLDSMQNGELRLFVYADHENWGFSILEAAREGDMLYSRNPGFVPFEAGAWETDFFDGRH